MAFSVAAWYFFCSDCRAAFDSFNFSSAATSPSFARPARSPSRFARSCDILDCDRNPSAFLSASSALCIASSRSLTALSLC